MTILVTGGAGYIGSHMVWALLDAGESVVAIDNLSTGFDWVLPKECILYRGDIADQHLVSKILEEHAINAIIHFAGSTVVPDSVRNPLVYYENNTAKSRSLIESAVNANVPYFIFSSTAAVYGTPLGAQAVVERQNLSPESPYGQSKLMTELMLHDAGSAHGLTYTVLRYFNVAGADPKGRTGQSTASATHLIKSACAASLGLKPHLEIFGTDYPTHDGTCIRDYIHVADLVNAHLKALRRMRDGGSSLTANCGYGHGYSVLDVIRTIEKMTNKSLPIIYGKRREGDPVTVVANPTLAKQELGWVPQHEELETIIGHALAWEQHLITKNSAS